MSAFGDEVDVVKRQEEIALELESCGDDMDKMGQLLGALQTLLPSLPALRPLLRGSLPVALQLRVGNWPQGGAAWFLFSSLPHRPVSSADELAALDAKSETLDVGLVDKKIDQMMPQLGFRSADASRKVGSFSGGWQMRLCLGKTLLRDPDLLLLDEPTNHLDLDAIEWLEGEHSGGGTAEVLHGYCRGAAWVLQRCYVGTAGGRVGRVAVLLLLLLTQPPRPAR
jgi:hypothetical protein